MYLFGSVVYLDEEGAVCLRNDGLYSYANHEL